MLGSRSRRLLLALIAAVGLQLRSVILAVPPVLPQLRGDLHLSFTATGALTAIPVLGLGAAAIPGSWLIARLGARSVVGAGVIGLGLAGLLRLLPPEPVPLYLFSTLMALSIAIAQPAMPAMIRDRFPDAIQPTTTVFTTCLGMGGLAASALTAGLALRTGWRGTFVIWSLPALGVGVAWVLLAPGRQERRPHPIGLAGLLHDRTVWHVAGLFGLQSLIYYAAAAWLPFDVARRGAGYLSVTLLLLGMGSLPVGAALVGWRWPWARSRRFYVLSGCLALVATVGLAAGPVGLAWLWAAALGVGVAMAFTGSSALPAIFARSPELVGGYAALVLTAGYAISFVGPLLGGILIDRTRSVDTAFWMMAAAALALLVLGLTLPRLTSAATDAG
jgi:CP family cyanate transporter-like MFS transporter